MTRTTRGVAAALGAVTILVGAAAQVSAAEARQNVTAQADPAASPATYASFLRHSHEEGAADALNAFQHLTRAEQNKFIDYLHDPALLNAFLDKAAVHDERVSTHVRNVSSATALRNGDVTVEQKRVVSGLAAGARPLPKGNHTVTYTTYVKYFGVKVIKLNLSVDFHSNGHDITKVNDADASKKNLSGVINISHAIPKKSLSNWSWCPRGRHCSRGHHADASVIWEGSLVFRGSTFQVDKKQWMRANVYGKLDDYYLKNV